MLYYDNFRDFSLEGELCLPICTVQKEGTESRRLITSFHDRRVANSMLLAASLPPPPAVPLLIRTVSLIVIVVLVSWDSLKACEWYKDRKGTGGRVEWLFYLSERDGKGDDVRYATLKYAKCECKAWALPMIIGYVYYWFLSAGNEYNVRLCNW